MDKAPVDLLAIEIAAITPFRMTALVIFILAIFHTLFANHFTALAERLSEKKVKHIEFIVEVFRFLGEVEVIFALWVIPLVLAICSFFNWQTAIHYLNSRSYIEPFLVVVVMTIAATRPIVMIVEGGLWLLAQLLGGSLAAWWFIILTVGPVLGSFITEVGAMTICALLLMRTIYIHNPSKKLAYGTIGLLFVNVAIGGMLTNFAAPPVLIIARAWGWSSGYMFMNFGWKALAAIVLSNTLYYLFLRKEFVQLQRNKKERDLKEKEEKPRPVPLWITAVHIACLVIVVMNAHYPAIFVGVFLLFLGFHQATVGHQSLIQLKRPMLVGMFLAGLIIHGGLQGWWIEPMLGNLTDGTMMLVAMVLTPFNDNAAITYLATLIPNLSEDVKYAIVSGVVAGGGLTVIANAPNPAGQVLLKKYFKRGVSSLYLFLGALIPTAIAWGFFYFF
jgi:hypothetical protein